LAALGDVEGELSDDKYEAAELFGRGAAAVSTRRLPSRQHVAIWRERLWERLMIGFKKVFKKEREKKTESSVPRGINRLVQDDSVPFSSRRRFLNRPVPGPIRNCVFRDLQSFNSAVCILVSRNN